VLSIDSLRANAIAKAGTDEFGDEWFLEPLGVLVKALNEEAQLSELGHSMTERRLTALLVDRLRLRKLQAENPEILDTPVEVAAEILGLPRTGSTLLHRLMSASPQLTSTLSWECSYPLPFPGESPAAEVRKGKAKKMMEMFLELSPEFGDIHTVVWDGPEEDILLLDRTFTAMSYDSFYWVPTYGVWLRGYDQSRAYAELREWLQVLQWQDPERAGKKWVLKSPHHLTAVDTTLDEFPECKIVMTHRSPTSAVPSYASMVQSMTSQYSDAADPVKIGQYWNERSANDTSRTVSPQTGQGSPVRACTRIPERFSPLSDAAPCPTERSTASVSTACSVSASTSTSATLRRAAVAYGDSRAVCRISSE